MNEDTFPPIYIRRQLDRQVQTNVNMSKHSDIPILNLYHRKKKLALLNGEFDAAASFCEINYKIIHTYNIFQRVKVLWCEHICMYLYGEQQSEETIVEETCYLWEAFEKCQGKIILLHFLTFW